MAINFSDCVIGLLALVISIPILHSHVWEPEVKVTEAKQAAFPLLAHAAAVTLSPRGLGPGSGAACVLRPVL